MFSSLIRWRVCSGVCEAMSVFSYSRLSLRDLEDCFLIFYLHCPGYFLDIESLLVRFLPLLVQRLKLWSE